MVNIVLLKSFGLLLIASIGLIYAGLLTVKSLVKISYRMKISEFIISFILLAFTTSIPELFIGITSAISKNPGLSLGNIIGASIMDVTLVIGIASILGRKFKITSKLIKNTSLYIIAIAAISVSLAAIGNGLSRLDGIILILISLLYMGRLVRMRKEYTVLLKKHQKKAVVSEKNTDGSRFRKFYYGIRDELSFNIAMFIIGIAILFISAKLVSSSAVGIALELNMSRILVGMIIVSIGTTLPELILEARAMLVKHQQIAFGDAMGSVAVNTTIIIGLVALIHPIEILNAGVFLIGSVFLILSTLLLSAMINFRKQITWIDGLLLILFYFVFVIIQLNANLIV